MRFYILYTCAFSVSQFDELTDGDGKNCIMDKLNDSDGFQYESRTNRVRIILFTEYTSKYIHICTPTNIYIYIHKYLHI